MQFLQDSGSSPSSVQSSVNVRGKLQNRFYEPIVLLLALTLTCIHHQTPKIPDSYSDGASQSLDQLFHDFVNKLSQICDNKRGGTTVSALAVLEYPDRVQYRLASNRRSESEMRQVKAFITDILNDLKRNMSNSSILKKVVAFNRPRLQIYVKTLHDESKKCLKTPDIEDAVAERLKELQETSSRADNRELGPDAFFDFCEKLMQLIKRLSKLAIYDVFRDKAHAAQGGERSPWAELRHAAGRMLSYLQAVKTLLDARKCWESLFDEFEVSCLLSSVPIKNPITRKSVTASEIIGRMTSDATMMAKYKSDAETLQMFQLDQNIKAQASKASFAPIVHAEVLVHQSILYETKSRASHFFNGYKYIGSSKPTCRLCDYYFSACASGIQVRQTHRNLYSNWRAPDVFKHQGEEAVKKREDIMNKMLMWIREDTFRTLSDKMPEKKQYDSNTDPTYLSFDTRSIGYTDQGDVDVDELATVFEELEVESFPESASITPRTTPPLVDRRKRAIIVADDDEDDGGGVRL